MRKPSTVAYSEFQDKFQNLLNESGLPAFVLIPVVKEALTQLHALSERQYQRDLEEWNKANTPSESEETDEDKKGEPNNGGQENQ